MEFNNEYEIEMEFNKKQKIYELKECKLCFHAIISTTIKCGHTMCSECCIKHFRKSDNCPFCRVVICKKKDRIKEYRSLIKHELYIRYYYEEYNDKLMSMYDFLKFKGINKKDANEILHSFEDRCVEMGIESDKYNEELYSDDDDDDDDDNNEDDNDNDSYYSYETRSDEDENTNNVNENTINSSNEVKQK
jgi:hypothetical protein